MRFRPVGIAGKTKLKRGPGEYEISGVLVLGITTFHDAEGGAKLGKNTVYLMEVDGVSFCHLGDLGHTLSSRQIEEIGNVDILLVPVGGGTTLGAPLATAVVRQLEPKIVVPMHYKTERLTREADTVDKFLKEMGKEQVAPQPKLTVNKSTLLEGTQIVLLSLPA